MALARLIVINTTESSLVRGAGVLAISSISISIIIVAVVVVRRCGEPIPDDNFSQMIQTQRIHFVLDGVTHRLIGGDRDKIGQAFRTRSTVVPGTAETPEGCNPPQTVDPGPGIQDFPKRCVALLVFDVPKQGIVFAIHKALVSGVGNTTLTILARDGRHTAQHGTTGRGGRYRG